MNKNNNLKIKAKKNTKIYNKKYYIKKFIVLSH